MEGNKQFIIEALQAYKPGEPIFNEDLVKKYARQFDVDEKKARLAINVCMNRIADNRENNLRRYKKGIYYRTVVTPFGEMNINQMRLIFRKYIDTNNGYETGLGLMNKMGLTTQMPRDICIVTNNVTNRPKNENCFTIRPARIRVDEKNIKYLQFLDALEMLDTTPIDAPDPLGVLFDYIKKNNLNYGGLLKVAKVAKYNQKVITEIARLAGSDETI